MKEKENGIHHHGNQRKHLCLHSRNSRDSSLQRHLAPSIIPSERSRFPTIERKKLNDSAGKGRGNSYLGGGSLSGPDRLWWKTRFSFVKPLFFIWRPVWATHESITQDKILRAGGREKQNELIEAAEGWQGNLKILVCKGNNIKQYN